MIENLFDRGHVRVVGSGGSRETEIDLGLGESGELRSGESEDEEERFHNFHSYYNFYN